MKCKTCGKEVGVDDPVCLHCGNPVSEEALKILKAQKSLKTRIRKFGNKVHTKFYNHRTVTWFMGYSGSLIAFYTFSYLLNADMSGTAVIYVTVLQIGLSWAIANSLVRWVRSF